MTVSRYAIIPTHNRLDRLVALLKSLEDQCEIAVVIDNASDEPISDVYLRQQTSVHTITVRDEEQPPNLYRLWNLGFDLIEPSARVLCETWDVAVLNDDVELPAGWYDYVAEGLRRGLPGHNIHPAVACTDPYGSTTYPIFKTVRDGNIMTRMCPWAFVVRGELGLRADESMRWWWGDTDFDWQACAAGGVLLLPGMTTKNALANSTTVGALAEQAGRDAETFAAKWGQRPW